MTASTSAAKARATDSRVGAIKRDPLGKAAVVGSVAAKSLLQGTERVALAVPQSARTLAETSSLGNGRFGKAPNERVKMGLCIDKKTTPTYVSGRYLGPSIALQQPE
jgi:hypothetical protein